MAVLIKGTGYIKARFGGQSRPIKAIGNHMKYIESQKEKHRNDVRLEDKQGNVVDRKEFMEKIKDQKQHGVLVHKLVFSVSEDEAKRDNIDMRELVRDTMTQYEAKYKTQLDYTYALHDDERHPHCHVVIRGRDENGKSVYINDKRMREMERYAERTKERMSERNLDRSDGLTLMEKLERERAESSFVPAYEFHEKERGYGRER